MHPGDRATAVGVYRFWRNSGAVGGALLAGAVADTFGFQDAIHAVAVITLVSGIAAALTVEANPALRPVPEEPEAQVAWR